MSRITDIRDVAASSKGNLTDALLQCLILADELEFTPLSEWVNLELSGYSEKQSLPDYRKTHTSLRSTLYEGNSYTKNYTIPNLLIPEQFREEAVSITISDGIPALLTLPDDGSMGVSSTFLTYVEGMINHSLQADHGPWVSVRNLTAPVPPGTFTAIIGSVQHRIVRFMIELNRMYPSDEKIRAESGQNQQQLGQVFSNTVSIGNVQNLVLGSSASQINQSSNVTVAVQEGDFDSLAGYLRSFRVDDSDIRALEPIAKKLVERDLSEETKRSFSEWVNDAVSHTPAAAGDVVSEASKHALTAGIIQGVIRFAPNAADWLQTIAPHLPLL